MEIDPERKFQIEQQIRAAYADTEKLGVVLDEDTARRMKAFMAG